MRVIALDAHGRRREFKGPSPGLGGLPARLRRLWRGWALANGDVRVLAIAAKGVWTAAERRRQERRLRMLAHRVRVISDAEAAYLGALGDRPGMLLLAGTGSMVLARDASGRWSRAGGLGPLLGDEGSAFWIGREWLRATMDGPGFAAARLILASPDPIAGIAALAPGVLGRARRGSRRARRITAAAQGALADLLLAASHPLDLEAPVVVSWAGGLLADAHFLAGVWRATRRRGVRVRPERPRESAAAAVARMAETLSRPAPFNRGC